MSSPGAEFLFLAAERLPYQNAKATIEMKSRAPSVAPTPIPALAPVERPWWGCGVEEADCGVEVADCGVLAVVEGLGREVVIEEEVAEDDVVAGVEVEGFDVVEAGEVEDSELVLEVMAVVVPVLVPPRCKVCINSEQATWGEQEESVPQFGWQRIQADRLMLLHR